MGAVYGAGLLGVVIVGLIVTYLVVHRRETGEPPRRRELKQLRRELYATRLALSEVRHLVDLYQGQLDLVGDAFAGAVREVIRDHDQKILDPRKKEDQ